MAKKAFVENLSQDFVKCILQYDKDTGEFYWKERADYSNTWNTRRVGKIAGCYAKNGYKLIRINDKLYKGHRIAWLYIYGEWPDLDIDHADGNPSNNRISNLRIATSSQNHCNSKRQSNNTSGYKGVSFDKKARKYHAYIKVNNKRHHIGYYPTALEASQAYQSIATTMHGKFARFV